jgi:hypothetical protein
MSSATSQVKHRASRAADSKPLEMLARGGFIGYGVIHLLFAWIVAQVAFGGSKQESDQSGALQSLAGNSFGKVLLVLIAIGMVAPSASPARRRRPRSPSGSSPASGPSSTFPSRGTR